MLLRPIRYTHSLCLRVLRNWPYPSRPKVLRFPVITQDNDKASVVVLCRGKHFYEGLWSLWSWMWHLQRPMRAVLLFDGIASTQQREEFQALFPKGWLIDIRRFLAEQPLSDSMRVFLEGNWTAHKLAAVVELQKQADILYSDCDVLVFKQPEELITAMEAGRACYYRDLTGGFTLDPWLLERGKQLGITAPADFNSGVVYVPKGSIKVETASLLLDGWHGGVNHTFTEQVLFSMLLDPLNTTPLPSDNYVISDTGYSLWDKDLDPATLISRHYTSTVRHRMYLTGYPFLCRQARRRSKS